MKKFEGTITLSILDEDNSQRIIFRIIPLCTKDGLIFQNQKTSYPDYGSIRVIPDKREQSSFKERMREIGNLCCVELCSDGKEQTKIRQNRNYDPNQGEYNQYAIYSDVICGFEDDAVFEVFQEDQDSGKALTDSVLLQRGKVLFGPLPKGDAPDWEAMKPFGNENFLLHTVEDPNGNSRTYYWNPEAIVTWRQRKKALRRGDNPAKIPLEIPAAHAPEAQPAQEQIPIGIKLDILDEDRTNQEHITDLNMPISTNANRLDHSDKPRAAEVPAETPYFSGTPIADSPKFDAKERNNGSGMQGVVERQLKCKQSNGEMAKADRRPVENPIENLRVSLQNVWNIPALHPELFQLLAENRDILQAMMQTSLIDGHTKGAYSAAKAELDEIEGERISLLIELDKVKANYQHIKEKMYMELAKQKQNELSTLETHIEKLTAEKQALEALVTGLGNQLQQDTMDLYLQNKKIEIVTNGSDLTLSPTIGYHMEPGELVETIRSIMNHMGFMCKQDCVTELMIFLSLYDEIYVLAHTLWEAEYYMKNILRALGLQNVSAWPSVFGTLHITSLLPENDLRTPTVDVIKNNRTSIRAYGHKTIRLIDYKGIPSACPLPIIQVPEFNKARGQDRLHENGKPISLQTLHAFAPNANLLYKDGEAWFDKLEKKLEAQALSVSGEVYQAMRMFTRVTAPQVVGGFMEAADAAALAWIVPVLLAAKLPKERLEALIGDLPRCMRAMSGEHA